VLAVAREDLEWFELPAVARKLLELVDGHASIEIIAATAEVPLIDASNLFDDLVREGIVTST
jgi:hypothetical protein